MERFEKIRYLNEILLGEMPEYRAQAAQFSQEEAAQRRLLRSLMNLRPPRPVYDKLLELELGVGSNTPAIIKYPFWKYTRANPKAVYACVHLGEAMARRKSTGSPSASMPTSAVYLRCCHISFAS